MSDNVLAGWSDGSDGMTSAAPRSFRQNRPPARTLSYTYESSDHVHLNSLALEEPRKFAINFGTDQTRTTI